MNDIFTPTRFYLSVRRLFVEKGVKMLGSILIILMVITLLLNLQFDPGYYMEARIIFLIMALMFGPVLYMAAVANEFTNHSKGISYLLMPNSRFEKWLLNILVIALYFFIFGLLFRLVDIWMVGRLNMSFQLPEGALSVTPFNSDQFVIATLVGSAISLGVLLGSYFFKKNSLIISLTIMFALLILVFFFDYLFANLLLDGNVLFGDSAPFGSLRVTDPSTAAGHYHLEIPMTPTQLVNYIFIPILAILSLTYFVRIKEKQL